MKLDIPYGKEKVKLSLPDDLDLEVVEPNPVQTGDEGETLERALDNPIDYKSLDDFLANARDVTVLVNDGTRPTPTQAVLKLMGDRLKGKKIRFLVATGVHRPPTREEMNFIFGDLCSEYEGSIFAHDARAEDEHIYIGSSRNGTEMILNRLAVEAHKLLIIGSVEPHYFAGYTGGRKSFLPGVASYKTIEQNHKYAMSLKAQALALAGNPVHEDMVDAIRTIEDKEVFSIQTVLDPNRRIYAATAGHINGSFDRAIDKANEVFSVKVKRKADIVLTVAPYPMDVDLYQSQKAIDNGKLALKEGGILIMVSKCRTGIGEESFFNLLAQSSEAKGVLESIDRDYRLGYHKAAKMAEVALWAEMWAVSDLDDEKVKSVFMTPFHSVQDAVNAALEKKGRTAAVTVMPEGSVTVPRIA